MTESGIGGREHATREREERKESKRGKGLAEGRTVRGVGMSRMAT